MLFRWLKKDKGATGNVETEEGWIYGKLRNAMTRREGDTRAERNILHRSVR